MHISSWLRLRISLRDCSGRKKTLSYEIFEVCQIFHYSGSVLRAEIMLFIFALVVFTFGCVLQAEINGNDGFIKHDHRWHNSLFKSVEEHQEGLDLAQLRASAEWIYTTSMRTLLQEKNLNIGEVWALVVCVPTRSPRRVYIP